MMSSIRAGGKRLQAARHFPGSAVANRPAVGLEDRRQLAHCSARERFVGGVQLGQRKILFPSRHRFRGTHVEDHLSRQSGETGIGEWRHQLAVLHDEDIGVIGFGYESVDVEHDGTVDARHVGVDRRQDVVQEVVVVDF